MKRLLAVLISMTFMTAILAGCSSGVRQVYNVNSYDDLVEAFRAKEYNVKEIDLEELGHREVKFFSESPSYFHLGDNENWITVYEFEDAETAITEAETIKDGYSIGNKQISWVAQPYFFQKNRLIVILVSDNDKLLADFTDVLGNPIR